MSVFGCHELVDHRGLKPNGDIARPVPGTDERDGNIKAETEWLLLIAQA